MLRELIAYFGFEVDSSQVTEGKKKLDDFENQISRLTTVVGGGLLARGFLRMTDSLIDTGNALAKNSEKFGLSVDEFSQWDFAAQHAGVSTEQFGTSLKFLEKNMAKSDGIGGKALKDFAQLGIELGGTGDKMKPTLEVFAELADKVKDAKNPAEQMGIALRFLGRGSSEMVPLLKKGGDGIRALVARFKEITGGDGSFAQFAEDAEKAKDAQIDFGLGMDVLRNRFAGAFLPVITRVLDKLLHFSVMVREFTKDTKAAEAAVIVLAGTGFAALIYAFGGLALAAAPWIAALTAVYLVVDDLYVLFTGGESVIGKFLDAIFGFEDAKGIVDSVRTAFKDFVEWLKEEGPHIKAFWKAEVLPAIKEFFDYVVDNKGEIKAFFEGIASAARSVASAFRETKQIMGEVFGDSDKHTYSAVDQVHDNLGNLGAKIMGMDNLRYGRHNHVLGNVGEQAKASDPGFVNDMVRGASMDENLNPTQSVNQTTTQNNTFNISGAQSPAEVAKQVVKYQAEASAQASLNNVASP